MTKWPLLTESEDTIFISHLDNPRCASGTQFTAQGRDMLQEFQKGPHRLFSSGCFSCLWGPVCSDYTKSLRYFSVFAVWTLHLLSFFPYPLTRFPCLSEKRGTPQDTTILLSKLHLLIIFCLSSPFYNQEDEAERAQMWSLRIRKGSKLCE